MHTHNSTTTINNFLNDGNYVRHIFKSLNNKKKKKPMMMGFELREIWDFFKFGSLFDRKLTSDKQFQVTF